ncbi:MULTISPECIES: HD domain-containing protein [unclassified Butyrivibrio]|jgi:hypothetical protein|uniref:HD domain-containing protein n=1 Tax=unclassified Butyrivibrio TaxID=2639466 RepID=UPI0003B78297|nr:MULTISPECIES: HD domain-containing protein [unclassified Butyrivibrio]
MDRNNILTEFKKYTDQYNPEDVKVKLKIDHTYRVADLCEIIARSLLLPEEDCEFAWLSGILHDIGRFEQLRRYHTFQDRISVNHAELSADLLFKDEQLIDRFDPDRKMDREMMEKVIRYHNVYILPDGQTDRERMFCEILRDADKIDIIRVNCETPRTEIYDLPEKAFTDSYITDEVYEDIMGSGNIDRTYSKTGIDYILGHISFVYGLVFPESIRQVKSQGYIYRLLGFKSNNPDTVKKMQFIREKIINYLECA